MLMIFHLNYEISKNKLHTSKKKPDLNLSGNLSAARVQMSRETHSDNYDYRNSSAQNQISSCHKHN